MNKASGFEQILVCLEGISKARKSLVCKRSNAVLKLLVFVVPMMLFFAASSVSAESEMIEIASPGREATIVIAEDASEMIRKAADELAGCLQQSTGKAVHVEHATQTDRTEIHVGQTAYVRSLNLSSDELKGDGFKILFPTPRQIVLLGKSDHGTTYAVYEFLERYIGVRWLFPGELGTYVPKQDTIAIPMTEVASQPAFISRTISTMQAAEPGEVVDEWLQHHRRHWTIQHHHNLLKLFDVEKFFDRHPDFYPIRHGKRYKPAPAAQDWNPVLDAPGAAGFAVDQINQYFDAYPSATSYSLGINDTNEFQHPGAGINSVGLEDYSDYFFTFANAVAEGVLAKHPDKWFGCLAYVGITDPPKTVGVNARIVPHICIDRQGWASEEHAERDMQRTRDWHAVAPVLGWYDYIYGDDMYRIPRIYPHLMARYLRFAAENGVQAYYAEHYGSPAWVEGPKMYVLMKLLWNPNADVDALLNEWYTLTVGEKAAVPLAQYYQLWEDYWMGRVRETDWFQQNVGKVYFDFDRIGYLDQLTSADLDEAQRLMNEVVRLAETPEQKARAEFFAQGFNDLNRDVGYYVSLHGRAVNESAIRSSIFAGGFAPEEAVDDKIPQPWGGWQNEPGQARFYWDHRIGYDDQHSLAIDAARGGTGAAIIYHEFPASDLNATYCLTAIVQADAVNDDADIGIEIRWEREDGQYLPRKYTSNQFLRGSDFKQGEWKRFTLFFRPPAEVGPVKMRVILGTVNARQGVIRYDNVGLATIDESKLDESR